MQTEGVVKGKEDKCEGEHASSIEIVNLSKFRINVERLRPLGYRQSPIATVLRGQEHLERVNDLEYEGGKHQHVDRLRPLGYRQSPIATVLRGQEHLERVNDLEYEGSKRPVSQSPILVCFLETCRIRCRLMSPEMSNGHGWTLEPSRLPSAYHHRHP
ncbi:hypothetical protein E5Q_00946 [Mixia osmundae IAM 14324]|uniref:Uncharacterized protein n=1 Tax=Mixia osmundae (strain CBS 9802 / IAM 14324 / JCM 22182 / KY 12970) TaxID=764103 RepID=G7DUN7_MIXOS|nr:hypothetical protein E5Q_00946 [Mixia osmundae IAM 14324]